MPILVIAERSEANNRDLWASKFQLAFIHSYIYYVHAYVRLYPQVCQSRFPGPRGTRGGGGGGVRLTHVQNGLFHLIVIHPCRGEFAMNPPIGQNLGRHYLPQDRLLMRDLPPKTNQ